MYRVGPRLHNAIVQYFSGVARSAADANLRDTIVNRAEDGDYDSAHSLSIRNGLVDPNNTYARYKTFPVELFMSNVMTKREQEMQGRKSFASQPLRRSAENSIHPGVRSVKLNMNSLRHIANEQWDKLRPSALANISEAVAKYGFSGTGSHGPLDSSDFVNYARSQVSSQRAKSLAALRRGLLKGLEGTNRDPEDQRRQDMDTGFFRRPKTHRGQHPKANEIMAYFNHYSSMISPDARATIMHDAQLGEYGSAQRKLARRIDRLPAGLDGLKFGDYQIDMIHDMYRKGIFQ